MFAVSLKILLQRINRLKSDFAQQCLEGHVQAHGVEAKNHTNHVVDVDGLALTMDLLLRSRECQKRFDAKTFPE